MLLNHLNYNEVVWIGTQVSIFLKVVFDVSPGTQEGSWISVFFTNFQGKETQPLHSTYQEQRHRLPSRNSWEGRVSSRPSDTGPASSLVCSCQIMRTPFGSAFGIHEDLLLDDAKVTHVVICQGRDHIVNIRSGCRSLAVVNVHFEPELTLRSLLEVLRLITAHWPQYPCAIGMIMGDFHICEAEEGRFNVRNQTFTDGDTGKAAFFHSFSSRSRNCSANGVIRTLSRIHRAFINIPWAEARDFHCYSHVF